MSDGTVRPQPNVDAGATRWTGMSHQHDADEGLPAQSVDNVPQGLIALYRGEIERVSTWRSRLDNTTNWAVTIIAAVLTWVFSSPDNPHYLLLVGMLTVVAFHLVETERYRRYDVWRARVRLLERNVFAASIDPENSADHQDWRSKLCIDLRRPALKMPFVEAYARRYRRVYLPLQTMLLVAWVVRLTVFAADQGPIATASVVGVPGEVVIAVVVLWYLVMAAITFWPRERQATGEIYHRGTEGEWKP